MSSTYISIKNAQTSSTFAVPNDQVADLAAGYTRQGYQVSIGAKVTPFTAEATSGAAMRQPFTPYVAARTEPAPTPPRPYFNVPQVLPTIAPVKTCPS